jgi:hypothetical protein
MNRKLLLVLALVMSTFAMTDDDAVATIKRLENHKFGQTILTTIDLQLQTNDSVDILLGLL